MANELQNMYDLCSRHMHAYVLVETNDGRQIDGIITGLEGDHVVMAVPNTEDYREAEEDNTYRQFGYWGPGYGGGFGGGFGFGHGRRRFNRFVLPLAALVALSVLPWY